MGKLSSSRVMRGGVKRGPGHEEAASRDVTARHTRHELSFHFVVPSSNGNSHFELKVAREDLPQLLDEIATMPGGARLLAEAAARAAARLDETVRQVADGLNALDDGYQDDARLHELAEQLDPVAVRPDE